MPLERTLYSRSDLDGDASANRVRRKEQVKELLERRFDLLLAVGSFNSESLVIRCCGVDPVEHAFQLRK